MAHGSFAAPTIRTRLHAGLGAVYGVSTGVRRLGLTVAGDSAIFCRRPYCFTAFGYRRQVYESAASTPGARSPDKSTVRAVTAPSATMTSPTEIGSLKRRGPQLPGLTYKIPSRSSIFGLCE